MEKQPLLMADYPTSGLIENIISGLLLGSPNALIMLFNPSGITLFLLCSYNFVLIFLLLSVISHHVYKVKDRLK